MRKPGGGRAGGGARQRSNGGERHRGLKDIRCKAAGHLRADARAHDTGRGRVGGAAIAQARGEAVPAPHQTQRRRRLQRGGRPAVGQHSFLPGLLPDRRGVSGLFGLRGKMRLKAWRHRYLQGK